jgi:hypothetical protein
MEGRYEMRPEFEGGFSVFVPELPSVAAQAVERPRREARFGVPAAGCPAIRDKEDALPKRKGLDAARPRFPCDGEKVLHLAVATGESAQLEPA